jgi:hypothetical protein
MLAGLVLSFHGAGGGVNVPHHEVFAGELLGCLRFFLILGGQGLMIRRRVRLADLLLDGVPRLG